MLYDDCKKTFVFTVSLFKSVLFLCAEGEKMFAGFFREWKRRGYRIPPMTREKALLLCCLLLIALAIIGTHFIPREIWNGDFLFG